MGNFYVNTFLPESVYMQINKKDIPKEIIAEYKLTDKYFDQDGYAMVEVMKAIYGLPQSS